jgi:hypothetical protein
MTLPVITPTVLPDAHEVTMAAPNVICVEVYEPEVDFGTLVEMGGLTGEAYNTWVTRNNPDRGGASDIGFVLGADKTHIRFKDNFNTVYFDKDAILNAAGYATIGGCTVTKVSLKNYIRREGTWAAGTQVAGGTVSYVCGSFRWFVYLHLDDDLPQGGPYTIAWPDDTGITDTVFTFNDKVTRAHFLHTTYIGHRQSDVHKLAVFGGIIPGWSDHGQLHIDDIGVTQFDIIDIGGAVVYGPEDIVLHADASDGTQRTFIDTEYDPLQISSIAAGTPCVVTYAAGTWAPANDDVIAFRGVRPGTLFLSGSDVMYSSFFMVKNHNAGARTFEVYNSTGLTGVTLSGTYTLGYAADYSDQVLKTRSASNVGTYLFDCDYSDWTPPNENTYYVRVIGVGVSYPILVHEAVWNDFSAIHAQGEYHQRSGMALDGRFGYTRPIVQRHGVDGVTVYKSTFPINYMTTMTIILSTPERGGLSNNVNGVGANLTTETVDWWGEWHDAGDWDIFVQAHNLCHAHLLTAAIMRADLGLTANLVDYNIPESYDVIGTDYPETLPAQLNQGLWGAQHLLRLQDEDGGIIGSLEGTSPYDVVLNNGEAHIHGPTWISGNQWFATPPDMLGNFGASGVLALAAIALELYGATTKAEEYYQAAKLAYEFAEPLYNDAELEKDLYHDKITTQILFTADTTASGFTLTNCSDLTGVIEGMEITDVFNFGGDIASGSPIITNITGGTDGITVGSNIRGVHSNTTKIIPAATTVVSVDSATQITLSANATGTQTAARIRSRHTTGLPYVSSSGTDQAWSNSDGETPFPIANAIVASIDSSTQLTFSNVSPIGSTRGNKSTVSNKLYVARYPGAGWSEIMYTTNAATLKSRSTPERVFACGTLHRAATLLGHTADITANPTWADVCDDQINTQRTNNQSADLFGVIQYFFSCEDQGVKDQLITNLVNGCTVGSIVDIDDLVDGPFGPSRGCRSLGTINTAQPFGPLSNQGMARWPMFVDFLMRMEGDTPDPKYLRVLQASLASDHGASPTKISTTVGVGPHHWPNILHDNTNHTGEQVPNGVSAYGASGGQQGSFNVTGQIHRAAGQSSSTMHDFAEDAVNGLANYADKRTLDPPSRARPGWEYATHSRWSIGESEFTVQQSVMIKQLLTEYLHFWDGNTQNTPGVKRVRRTVTVTT